MTASPTRSRVPLLLVTVAGIAASFCAPVVAQDAGAGPAEEAQPSRPQSLLPGRIDAPPPPEESSAPEPLLPGSVSTTPSAPGTAEVPQTAASGPSAPTVEAVAVPLAIDASTIGPLTASNGGYGADLWNGSRGSFVNFIMPKLTTPVGSRFGQIALRRALATAAAPPPGANQIAFHTARTQLLLRLGEADLASKLAAAVPQQTYNRQMYAVAGQAHLAAFNVPATCPLASKAIVFSPDNLWPLLSAVCSAIQGDDSGAALGIDIARQSDKLKVNRFDLYLADRMLTAMSGGGRGGVIDWPKDGLLTSFRLAGIYAGGQSLPIAALKQKNSAVHGWIAKSGMADSTTRFVSAWTAASTGVLSTDEWIGLWAQRGSQMTSAQLAYAPEGLLVRANAAPYKERIAVMKQLWKLGKGNARADLAMRLLTSDAAARLPLNPVAIADSPELVRSMILGGCFAEARAWWTYLQSQKNNAAAQKALLEIWAGLELTDWKNTIPSNVKLLESWVNSQPADVKDRRGALLSAAMQGLGYGFAATADVQKFDLTPSGTAYERLADAAKRRAKGEVIILGSLLMGDSLDSISPETLHAVTKAYRMAGLQAEARLIAAEVVLQAGRDQ
jgi:hypothetical protein